MNSSSISILITFFAMFYYSGLSAQPIGYYNGTEGKSGSKLKEILHQKIKKQVDFSYSFSRSIMEYTDADPADPTHVILFYTQESRDASQYGSGGDFINREHVWAKSHGNFSGIRPMDSDVHNLHPADASVNEDRGNKDFDIVQPGGFQHPEATSCFFTDSTWEPGPLTKGQVARTLFYMATRYEGTYGEMDLELAARNNTYPAPLHGNLNALQQWNRQYPPSDFERRRNERLFRIQQNRNPFVDHPEFADYIWANETPTGPEFSNFAMSPEFPNSGDVITISLTIGNASDLSDVSIFWGETYDSEIHQTSMTKSGETYSAKLTLSGYSAGDLIYFKVVTNNTSSEKTNFRATYLLPENIQATQLVSISEVQGSGTSTPKVNQQVTISGRVTANFDNTFYLQSGNSKRSGINIYNTLFTGRVGDSLVVKGTATEYSDLTELGNISYVYNFKAVKTPEPVVLTASQVNEDYEGMLVQINNVTFDKPGSVIQEQNMSYTATDNTGSIVVYINKYSRLVQKSFPVTATNLVGIVSQYQGTYQILPRDISDFKEYTPNKSSFKVAHTNLLVYPNPATNILNIKSDEIVYSLTIRNLSGRNVIIQNQNMKQISIQNLHPGVYILEATFENGTITRSKFCKF